MTDILLIATSKYRKYIHKMCWSIRKHIKFPHRIILFTDSPFEQEKNVIEYMIKHEPYPYITLFRYHYFLQVNDYSDHILYVDVDAYFNADTGEEILGDLIAVRHCGYYFKSVFPQEQNPSSPLFPFQFKKYYGGGLQGGKRENYLALCKWCREKIDDALQKNLIPETPQQKFEFNKSVALRHHDETVLNCYLSLYPPSVELSPDYHFPEECLNGDTREEWRQAREHFINNCWMGIIPFQPKLVLIKK